MTKPDSLGQFEQLVLTAILGLRENAYGVTIHAKTQELAQPKTVSLGAVYVTLDRLEEKGLVASWLTDPTPQRGGRAKRCYRLEALGERALQESALTAKRVWEDVARVWGKGWAKEWGKRWRRGRRMTSGPSRTAEVIVAIFVPPACREEVVGDLHERYSSPRQYCLDALRTVPLVILSRILRTADLQVVFMQALALYAAFLTAAWLKDASFVREPWGLSRLVTPVAMVVLGLIMEDAYANPGRRSPLRLVRGPTVGVALALLSQEAFWISNLNLAVPFWIVLYGCAISLLSASTIRILFPPAADSLQAAKVHVSWQKHTSEVGERSESLIKVLKPVAAIVAVATVAALLEADSVSAKFRFGRLLVVTILIAYLLWKG